MIQNCCKKVRDINGRLFPCGNPKRPKGPECVEHRRAALKREREDKEHEERLRRMQAERVCAALRRATREQLREELRRRKLIAARSRSIRPALKAAGAAGRKDGAATGGEA